MPSSQPVALSLPQQRCRALALYLAVPAAHSVPLCQRHACTWTASGTRCTNSWARQTPGSSRPSRGSLNTIQRRRSRRTSISRGICGEAVQFSYVLKKMTPTRAGTSPGLSGSSHGERAACFAQCTKPAVAEEWSLAALGTSSHKRERASMLSAAQAAEGQEAGGCALAPA